MGINVAIQKAMVSSNTNEWATPRKFFDNLNAEFNFTLDPCSTHENALCEKHYTIAENGLLQEWTDEIVFMNPPYGRQIHLWIKKAWEESLRGATVVCLIKPTTDTKYWHEFIFPYAAQVRFIKGRLKFGNSNDAAPFSSAVVIFTEKIFFGERFVPMNIPQTI